ncbi:MAG: acyltransferase [Actinobacteria bacterium]|nr:acyltransferase [Actinomycetota bacterium]
MVQLTIPADHGKSDGAARTRRRFGYLPPLDGIRALAVLGVIAYHAGVPFLQGGFLGVDAFFVLSGFLITSLLLEERIGTGKIGLRAFWARRARRLLPALMLMIIGVLLYARFIAPPGAYPGLRLDALSTLFYVANWHFILVSQNYFVLTGLPTPLLHTWSLSIEEQFYLVWPFVVLAVMRFARSPKRLMVVSAVMACASALEMGLLYRSPVDTSRVYFGTDTHSSGLLLGAALASGIVWWRNDRSLQSHDFHLRRPATTFWVVVGITGFAVSGIMWWLMLGTTSFPYQGGIFLAGLAVAGVIGSVVLVPRGPLYRLLSLRPLRYLGKISYGMYLWHWPLIIFLDHARTGLLGWNLVGVRVGSTVAMATLSFYLLERPIRQGTLFRSRRAMVLTPLATAGMVTAIIVATVVPVSAVTLKSPPKAPTLVSGTNPAHPVRVLVVGDSVALTLAYGLDVAAKAEPGYDVKISDKGILGCGIAMGGYVQIQGKTEQVGWACNPHAPPGNPPWPVLWSKWISEFKPDVVVLLAGRWEVANRTYHGHWTNIENPTYAAYIKSSIARAVQVGTSQGADMILMTAPCYDSGEQPDGLPWPEDSPARLDIYNSLLSQVAESADALRPGLVHVEHFHSLVCPHGHYQADFHGVEVRSPDGVHFTTPQGGEYLAPKILPVWERVGVLDRRQHAKPMPAASTS